MTARPEGDVASEDVQQRPDANAGAVRVATIHKSKGLEYGIVYCPFPWTRSFGDVAVTFHDEQGDIKVDLGSEHVRDATGKRATERSSPKPCDCSMWRLPARSIAARSIGAAPPAGRRRRSAMRSTGRRAWPSSTRTECGKAWRSLQQHRPARSAGVPRTTVTAAPCKHEAQGQPLAARDPVRTFSHAPRIASFTSLTGHDEKTPGVRKATQPPEVEPGSLC